MPVAISSDKYITQGGVRKNISRAGAAMTTVPLSLVLRQETRSLPSGVSRV